MNDGKKRVFKRKVTFSVTKLNCASQRQKVMQKLTNDPDVLFVSSPYFSPMTKEYYKETT